MIRTGSAHQCRIEGTEETVIRALRNASHFCQVVTYEVDQGISSHASALCQKLYR
jgi:hypothetical protein